MTGAILSDRSASARKAAFVSAACEAFFASGYAGTTMSSIATKVGGSKTTLWAYFPSKEHLFSAVVDDVVTQCGDALSIELPPDEDPLIILRRYATVLMRTLRYPPVLRLFRLVIGEAERFPHLADTFYVRGPKRGKARMTAYLASLMAQNILRPGDPAVAAQQFAGLCQSGAYQSEILNLRHSANSNLLVEEIDAAVDTFWRAWAAPIPHPKA